jgi:hypothetical protein
VTTIRASKRSESAAPALGPGCIFVAWLVGCAAASPAVVDAPSATGSAESPPRKPDAVVVEPPAAMPAVSLRATARGVVALREPMAGDAVGAVVEQVAEAWQLGSLEGLMALLTVDAGPIEARARGRGPLVEGWRQRLHAHEYTRLAGVDLVRADRVERWTWDELGAAGGPSRPAGMRPDELYVRAPLEVTHIANEKVFGDAMVLLLRPEDGRYKVSAYGETYDR